MFRRRRQAAEATTRYMDTKLIGPLEERAPQETVPDDFFVRAVLFGTGEVKRLSRNTEVYGLVLAGYQGLQFGDDGTYTGMVASELPLDQDGTQRIEAVVDEAVRSVNPAYCAEYVGNIALDEAAVKLDAETKRNMGVEFPAQVSWSNGTLAFG